jgi:hypothetical protein
VKGDSSCVKLVNVGGNKCILDIPLHLNMLVIQVCVYIYIFFFKLSLLLCP